MSILWTRAVSLNDIDEKERTINDESGRIIKPMLFYSIKNMSLTCSSEKVDDDDNDHPHHGPHISVISKLEVNFETHILSYLNHNVRLVFWTHIFHTNNIEYDKIATPSGQTFVSPGGNTVIHNITCQTQNINNYQSLLNGDLAKKIKVRAFVYDR